MIEIKVEGWMPGEMMDVVRELRSKGYVQGSDFDFAYHQPKYADISGHLEYNRHTVFTFYTESLATWFSLIYL